jgi:CHASE3 domain sensor protein
MPLRRLVAFAGALLGFLGVIGCAVGMAAALWVGGRLDRANDRSFAAVQRSLTAARDLVVRAQDRAREMAAEDLGGAVRDWGKRAIAPELAARFDARAARVGQRLEQADVWLETSAASVRTIARTMELIGTVGGAGDGDDGNRDDERPLAVAADRIGELGARLQQVIATVDDIRRQAAPMAAAATARMEDRAREDERIPRLTRLADGVSAALRQIESRLGEAADRLSERQASAERLRVRVHRHIVLAVVGMVMVLAWMGAGQAALCAYGWKRWRAREQPAASGPRVF